MSDNLVLVIYDKEYYTKYKQQMITNIYGPFNCIRDLNRFKNEEYFKKREINGLMYSIHNLEGDNI